MNAGAAVTAIESPTGLEDSKEIQTHLATQDENLSEKGDSPTLISIETSSSSTISPSSWRTVCALDSTIVTSCGPWCNCMDVFLTLCAQSDPGDSGLSGFRA